MKNSTKEIKEQKDKVILSYCESSVDPSHRQYGEQIRTILKLKDIDCEIIDPSKIFRESCYGRLFGNRSFDINDSLELLKKDEERLLEILKKNIKENIIQNNKDIKPINVTNLFLETSKDREYIVEYNSKCIDNIASDGFRIANYESNISSEEVKKNNLINDLVNIFEKNIKQYVQDAIKSDLEGDNKEFGNVVNFIKANKEQYQKEDFLPIYQNLFTTIKSGENEDSELSRLKQIQRIDTLLSLVNGKVLDISNNGEKSKLLKNIDDVKAIEQNIDEEIKSRLKPARLNPDLHRTFYFHGNSANIAPPGRPYQYGRYVVEKIAMKVQGDNQDISNHIKVCGGHQEGGYLGQDQYSGMDSFVIARTFSPDKNHLGDIHKAKHLTGIGLGNIRCNGDKENAIEYLQTMGFSSNQSNNVSPSLENKNPIDLNCEHTQSCIVNKDQIKSILEKDPNTILVLVEIAVDDKCVPVERKLDNRRNSFTQSLVKIPEGEKVMILELMASNGNLSMQSHPDGLERLFFKDNKISVDQLRTSGLNDKLCKTEECYLVGNHGVIDKFVHGYKNVFFAKNSNDGKESNAKPSTNPVYKMTERVEKIFAGCVII